MHSVLLDTSFLIRFLNDSDKLFKNAEGYFKYFLEKEKEGIGLLQRKERITSKPAPIIIPQTKAATERVIKIRERDAAVSTKKTKRRYLNSLSNRSSF